MKNKAKILCNCPCKGPLCISLFHSCDKPKEHYPQREEAVRVISERARKKERLRIKRFLAKQGLAPNLE